METGTLTIQGGGSLTAKACDWCGAGIGGGKGMSSSNIVIKSGIITAIGYDAAGIGGGYEGDGTNITIEGGIVNATSIANGAGIGGGSYGGNGVNITISGGTVTATSNNDAAGIGGGNGGGNGIGITISGGDVTASDGGHGSGIGGGNGGDGKDILITGGTVSATARSMGAGIGGGSYGSGDVTITGGTVIATGGTSTMDCGAGAGIGGGGNGGTGTVMISGGNIDATGGAGSWGQDWDFESETMNWAYSGGGAGVGGGASGASTVSISGGVVNATGGSDASGVGNGYLGSDCSISITGGVVSASGGYGLSQDGTTTTEQAVALSGKSGDWTGIVFEDGVGTVYGNAVLTEDFALTEGMALSIPAGASLTIAKGVTLTVPENAALDNNGELICQGILDGEVSGSNAPSYPAVLSIENGSISISEVDGQIVVLQSGVQVPEDRISEGIVITGSSTENTITVDGVGTADDPLPITLRDLTIDVSATGGSWKEWGICALALESSATVSLALEGENTLKSGNCYAGINVPTGSTLIVGGDGTLDAVGGEHGGAGIGGNCRTSEMDTSGTVIINGGTIIATGGKSSINALSGAGIGGGDSGTNGIVVINGGTVTANGSGWAAGIGSGGNNGDGGIITINGGTVTATAGNQSAGIGGGNGGKSGVITITGGTVTALGSLSGAGIGSGDADVAESITISGGTVYAEGGVAGIGGTNGCGTILITGGEITAVGLERSADRCDVMIGGAGIGGGTATGDSITIEGGTVTATGGSLSPGIGGRGGNVSYAAPEITISGGTVTATGGSGAAGIGGCSGWGYEDEMIKRMIEEMPERDLDPVEVRDGSSANDITITGGTVTATGTDGGAGIGGGSGGTWGGSAGTGVVDITGGVVFATATSSIEGIDPGAAIGGGSSMATAGEDSPSDDWAGIVFNGGEGTVYGDATLTDDLTLAEGMTLTIPEGASLTIAKNTTLTISEGARLSLPDGADLTLSGGAALTTKIDGQTITVAAPKGGGTIGVGEDGSLSVSSGSTVQTGEGPVVTLIDGGTVNTDGTIAVPEGGTVKIGTNITLPSGGTVNGDGSVALPAGGQAVVTDSNGDTITITVPEGGGEISVNENGEITVPTGAAITTSDGSTTTITEGTGAVKPDGTITFPEGGKVTIADSEGNTTEVTVEAGETIDPTAPPHVHAWAEGWSKDEGHHWHECEAEGCDVTDNSDKDGYAEHIWGDGEETAAATCTEPGEKTYTCTVCGATKTEEIDPTGHSYGTEWESDATGHWHECPVCGDQKDFAAHTENNGVVTTQPTLEAEGVKTYSCTVCGYVMRTEAIEKLTPEHQHSFSEDWKSDVENHWRECDCGEKNDLAAHVPVTDEAVAATCTTPGKTEGSHCEICGYVITAQTETALADHTWDEGEVTTQPTCTEKGVRTYTCVVCQTTKTEDIDPTGHTEETIPGKSATCDEPGLTEGKKCSICGQVLTRQEEIPATGEHTYDGYESDETGHWQVCSKCDGITATESHVYDDDQDATCNVCGYERTITPPDPVVYTVTFDTQGGSEIVAQAVSESGKAAKPADPTRSGYTFGGWYKEADCATAWDFENDAVTADITLYAKWTTISGSSSSGSSSRKPTVSSGEGGNVTASRDDSVAITPDDGYQIAKITVNGKEVEIPADGKLTGLKRTDKVVVTFEPIPTPAPTTPASERFTDVKAGAWYEDAVTYVVDKGLFNGTSDTTFSPTATMTRGMLATVLYRAEGEPGALESIFSDVENGKWYTDGISWAAEKGIVAGYGNDLFGPEDDITREQLAVMLWRYAGEPETAGTLDSFTDAVQVSGYADKALRWAVEQGIVTGKGGGILDPKGNATRAEVATMLTRYLMSAETE